MVLFLSLFPRQDLARYSYECLQRYGAAAVKLSQITNFQLAKSSPRRSKTRNSLPSLTFRHLVKYSDIPLSPKLSSYLVDLLILLFSKCTTMDTARPAKSALYLKRWKHKENNPIDNFLTLSLCMSSPLYPPLAIFINFSNRVRNTLNMGCGTSSLAPNPEETTFKVHNSVRVHHPSPQQEDSPASKHSQNDDTNASPPTTTTHHASPPVLSHHTEIIDLYRKCGIFTTWDTDTLSSRELLNLYRQWEAKNPIAGKLMAEFVDGPAPKSGLEDVLEHLCSRACDLTEEKVALWTDLKVRCWKQCVGDCVPVMDEGLRLLVVRWGVGSENQISANRVF